MVFEEISKEIISELKEKHTYKNGVKICMCCKNIIRNKKKNSKYCKNCAEYIKKLTTKIYNNKRYKRK